MGSKATRRAAAAAFTAFALVGASVVIATEAEGVTPSAASHAAATHADAGPETGTSPRATLPPLDPAALQQAIAVHSGEAAAGTLALVRGGGQTWQGTSGDTQTGQQVAADAHFRIGSISKTFEAVVVLQLAGENRIDLNQSVQHYLPGLLPAAFRPISVRELLDMTSGLPQIGTGTPAPTSDQLIDGRFEYQTFTQII